MKRKMFAVGATVFAAGYFFAGWLEPSYRCAEAQHVVVEGDSLWSIASRHCTGDMRDAVDELVSRYGTLITPGQVIETR
jgi:hypothetical protein